MMKEDLKMLYKKSRLEQHAAELAPWQHMMFNEFSTMITHETDVYPCIPGRRGFLSDHLHFGFIAEPDSPHAAQELVLLLKQYGECSQDRDKYASLVVFTKPSAKYTDYSIEQYEEIFWSLINKTSSYDEKEWPSEISRDPSEASWEFCFDGHPYFTFCATPAHITRKSRHFSSFLLAFQPRWVFAEINDSTPFGRHMKKAIRTRLVEYDGIPFPVHPSLNWYGQKENLEWKQYYLRDDDKLPAQCPFARMRLQS
jgi:FPC/CPF motif-containing protein YcgG